MNLRPTATALPVLFLALVTVSAPERATAQADSACTWDRCALREHRTFFGSRLVQGSDDEKVAGIGWFAPALPFLAERSDSAASYYAAFRGKQNRGTGMLLAGFGALVVGAFVAAENDNAVGPVLLISGFTLSFAGIFSVVSGQNDLSRAVWWYNRTLPRGDLPSNRR